MDTPIEPSRNLGRLAILIVVVALMLSVAVYAIWSTMSAASSSGEICGLLPSSQMDYFASNTAPRFQYSTIRNYIQQGWEALCHNSDFVAAIQAHGAGSFISGGGSIDPSDYHGSFMVVAVSWSQSTGGSCTQYTEKWAIFIGNGTASAPTTTSDICPGG